MSVEILIEALQAEAAEKEERLMADARTEAAKILADARATVNRLDDERRADDARKETNRQRVAAAHETLRGRRNEILVQQGALDTVREKAKERWLAFMESDAYTGHIHRRWAIAASLLGKIGDVRADPVTARALRGSGAPAPTVDPTVDDGFVAASSDGAVEVHERFIVRWERLWEREGASYGATLAKGVADVL